MGKLNIARNLFLEKEELIRQFDKFHRDEGFLRNLDIMTKSYGVIPIVNNDIGDNFKIVSDTATTFSLSSAVTTHKAMLEDGYVSVDQSDWSYTSPTDDTWRYISVGYDTTNLEKGTLSLASDGSITGTSTEFTKVLRGITTNVPTKIRIFQSDGVTEIGDYQVISVDSATSCSIVGNTTTGTGFKYQVIGSFSPSETDIPDSDRDIYEYDSYDFNISTSSTIPTGYISLARVKTDGVTASVEDLRVNIWMLKDNANAGYVDLDDYSEYGYNDPYVIIPRWGRSFDCTIPTDAQIDGFKYNSASGGIENIRDVRNFTIKFLKDTNTDNSFFNIADGEINFDLRQTGFYISSLIGLGLPVEELNFYEFFSYAEINGTVNLTSIHSDHLSVNNLFEFDIADIRSDYPNFDTFVREGSNGFNFRGLGSATYLDSAFTTSDLDSGIYWGRTDIAAATDFPDISDLSGVPSYTTFLLKINSKESNTDGGRYPRFYELKIMDSSFRPIYIFYGSMGDPLDSLSWRKINKGKYKEPVEFETSNFGTGWSKYAGTDLGEPLTYEVIGNEVKIEGWISFDEGVSGSGNEVLANMSNSVGGYGNIKPSSKLYGRAFKEDGSDVLLTIDLIFDGSVFIDVSGVTGTENFYINVSYKRGITY